jgi:hypothetical protein
VLFEVRGGAGSWVVTLNLQSELEERPDLQCFRILWTRVGLPEELCGVEELSQFGPHIFRTEFRVVQLGEIDECGNGGSAIVEGVQKSTYQVIVKCLPGPVACSG